MVELPVEVVVGEQVTEAVADPESVTVAVRVDDVDPVELPDTVGLPLNVDDSVTLGEVETVTLAESEVELVLVRVGDSVTDMVTDEEAEDVADTV